MCIQKRAKNCNDCQAICAHVCAAVDGLAVEPRPSHSLALSNIVTPRPGLSLHRLRLDKWRIIYAIDETDKVVDILAVRKRPPYDYRDLPELIRRLHA